MPIIKHDSQMVNSLDLPVRELLVRMQARIMNGTSWFGVKALKNPLDFWVYQEIIYEQRPDVIVEIGNHSGGSSLALAHLCDLLGHGRIIGIDINLSAVPQTVRDHPRITLIEGDACDKYPVVSKLAESAKNVLVIEDSSHTYENTLNVLRAYSKLIRPGNYFIVEDGICHHGLDIGPNPGPYEAIATFIQENQSFEIDPAREAFLVTWNPNGFLRRRVV